MALSWKLVVDTRDAPALADFWAAALEYEVEDPSALVAQLLAAGHLHRTSSAPLGRLARHADVHNVDLVDPPTGTALRSTQVTSSSAQPRLAGRQPLLVVGVLRVRT